MLSPHQSHLKSDQIALIAAVSENGVIGKNGKLPWNIPEDLEFFKIKTSGSVVIMGRKTWDSLPTSVKPLPNRVNVVISSTLLEKNIFTQNILEKFQSKKKKPHYVFSNLDRACEVCQKDFPNEKIFIIGGQKIYQQALAKNLPQILWITKVYEHIKNGDAFFPEIPLNYAKTWQEKSITGRCAFMKYSKKY